MVITRTADLRRVKCRKTSRQKRHNSMRKGENIDVSRLLMKAWVIDLWDMMNGKRTLDCDRKQENRILRPKVVVQANVRVTAKRLDYYVEITNRERSFGSNWWVKVERGQLWSDQSPSWTSLGFLTTTVCSSARDRKFSKISVTGTRRKLNNKANSNRQFVIGCLWLGVCDWVFVIGCLWLGVCDWVFVIGCLWLGVCDWVFVIGCLWLGVCDWVFVVECLWLGACDWVFVIGCLWLGVATHAILSSCMIEHRSSAIRSPNLVFWDVIAHLHWSCYLGLYTHHSLPHSHGS